MSTPSPSDNTKELTDELTRQKAVERLQRFLGLDIAGTKATTEMVFKPLNIFMRKFLNVAVVVVL